MKIIYPYPMQISKGYTYMLSIIQFLNTLAKFIPVDLLCLDTEESIKDYLNNNLGIELSQNLSIVQISNKGFGVKSNKLFFIKNVLKHLNNCQSERIIIYTRDFKQMRLCIKKLKYLNLNMKFIFEVHQILSQNYYRNGDLKKASEMKELESYVFQNVDGLVCITSPLSIEITRIFNNCTKNHLILPIGFNKDFLLLKHSKNKKYDIIYSGNFSKWKGLNTLIEAISIIKSRYQRDIQAILIGADDTSKKHYLNEAKKLNVLNNIEIINRIDHKEIYKYIAESKVGVLSNKYEADGRLFTSPLKLYEYLGAGLKVVVSKLPSIQSNIDESLVYYATPENAESFAKTILLAIDDVNFDSKYVQDFAKKYTWESRANIFLDFIL